jgi:hypothetical protein
VTDRQRLVLVNLIGGPLVLASYVLWLGHPSNDAGALWGSVPPFGQSLYTASMLAATAGYFAFESYLLRLDPSRVGPSRHAEIVLLHALILFPSALWMPLTYEYLDGPSAGIWWMMRATLFVVGAASAALIGTIIRLPGFRAIGDDHRRRRVHPPDRHPRRVHLAALFSGMN